MSKNPFNWAQAQTQATRAVASHMCSCHGQAQPKELRPSSEKLKPDREMPFQAWCTIDRTLRSAPISPRLPKTSVGIRLPSKHFSHPASPAFRIARDARISPTEDDHEPPGVCWQSITAAWRDLGPIPEVPEFPSRQGYPTAREANVG